MSNDCQAVVCRWRCTCIIYPDALHQYKGIAVWSIFKFKSGWDLASEKYEPKISQLLTLRSQLMTNLSKLLKTALLLPISSVPCIRRFSTKNRSLSKFLTSLSNSTLNYLVHISEDGPACCNVYFVIQSIKCMIMTGRQKFQCCELCP